VRAAVVASLATLLLALVVTPPGVAAAAGGFTAGDVVVYRVGDGTAAATSSGTPVFLDEFAPTGALQTPALSVALPTAAGGGGNVANNPVVASGVATSEGLLTTSTNGQYLLATGYDTPVGTAGVAASTVPRSVAEVDSTGAINSTTAVTNFGVNGTGNNPRSAASVDGSQLWMAGGIGGLVTAPLGTNGAGTVVSSTVANLRQVDIYGGQLYASTASGSAVRIGSVGTGLPTTPGQALTNLAGIPTSSSGTLTSPYSFALVSLGSLGTAVDTLYVADNVAGIEKFSLISGTWTAEGVITPVGVSGFSGLAASVSGTTVTVFATTPATLYTLTDTSGPDATMTGTFAALATAPANEAYRGVALAPTPLPGPSVPEVPFAVALPVGALLVMLGWFLLRRRRATHA